MQIYLTEEGVEQIEQKIADLAFINTETTKAGIAVLQYILKDAIILPVYRSWDEVESGLYEKTIELKHGVIIRGEDDGE